MTAVKGTRIENQAVAQASTYLCELLQSAPYRYRWIRHGVERERRGKVHQRAVVEVIRTYILDYSDVDTYESVSLQSLPQRVSLALRGEVLSRRTLELFIDAFAIADPEADRLRRLHEGTDKIRVLRAISPDTPEMAAAFGSVRHRTLSIHEHHYIGPDGLPVRHRTQQVIQANDAGLERYPYRFDTNALTVEVEAGGRLGGQLYEVGGGIHAVDIELDEPLAAYDTTVLTYLTLFHYSEPPKPEFRRAAHRRITDVSIRVEFDPARTPEKIWWAIWDGVDGAVTEREEATLRGGKFVCRYLESMENSVVGFMWDW